MRAFKRLAQNPLAKQDPKKDRGWVPGTPKFSAQSLCSGMSTGYRLYFPEKF